MDGRVRMDMFATLKIFTCSISYSYVPARRDPEIGSRGASFLIIKVDPLVEHMLDM